MVRHVSIALDAITPSAAPPALPGWPRTRSCGLATIAAKLLFTAQPKFELVEEAKSGCEGRLQSGQRSTRATARLTTTRTEPAGTSPGVTGASGKSSMP